MKLWRILPFAACALSPAALADQFHYNNVLVGTRAVGLGGAFTAVADDASGLYYNPAGLAFALSNDIQGSANAFYEKSTTYKKALGDDDFKETSSGSLTPFFGGLQKLDKYVEGLVFAFGVYYTDGDQKDQDTPIENKDINGTVVQRYHRTSNERAGTYYAGAAVGYRPRPNIAFGFGVTYMNADELVQEFQYARQEISLKLSDGSTQDAYRILDSNVRQHLQIYGLQPVLGFQAALPAGFSVGVTLKKTFTASQSFDQASESNSSILTDAQNQAIPTEGNGSVDSPVQMSQNVSLIKSSNPAGSLPYEARLGVAWFASPTLLLSFDAVYISAVTDADKSVDPSGLRAPYAKDAVTNYALGSEWYVAPSFPLRVGVFTNNDARPVIAKASSDVQAAAKTAGNGSACNVAFYAQKYCGQPDHIDYVGGSLFIAWVQPNSQISVGATYQQGSGQAQKLGDDKTQDVISNQYSIAFSATHNL